MWQWAYSAFGDEDPTTAAKRFTSATTPSNGSTSAPDLIFNLGYWGMYRDKESGLAQNRHRYYDARTGRYTQPDPIGWAGGSNPFTYVEGNPVSFVDPDGLQTQKGFTRKPTDLIPLEGGGGGGLGGGPTVGGRSLLGGKPSAGNSVRRKCEILWIESGLARGTLTAMMGQYFRTGRACCLRRRTGITGNGYTPRPAFKARGFNVW